MQPPSEQSTGMTVPNETRTPTRAPVEPPRVRALSDKAFHRYQRAVWAICIVVYLTVFLGGLHAGGSELMSVGRAAAFTFLAALLGRTALGLLGGATAPGEAVPMAVPEGKVGSLVDLLGSTIVASQEEQTKDDDSAAAA
jgi:hypothetical protein